MPDIVAETAENQGKDIQIGEDAGHFGEFGEEIAIVHH